MSFLFKMFYGNHNFEHQLFIYLYFSWIRIKKIYSDEMEIDEKYEKCSQFYSNYVRLLKQSL